MATLRCPVCKASGEIRGTEDSFAMRGLSPDSPDFPAYKCLACGGGLTVTPRPYPPWVKGKPTAPGAWAYVEATWEAEFGEEKVDPVLSSQADDLFMRAATALSKICTNNERLPAPDRALGPSCLKAGAAVASNLASLEDVESSDTDSSDADIELSTQGFLAAVLAEDDAEAAVRAVYALSWYFALASFGEREETISRDKWLSITQEMLGPSEIDFLQIASHDQLIALFESTVCPNNNFSFYGQVCEWLNFCLGDEWDEGVPAGTAMIVQIVCRAGIDAFWKSVREAGLVTQ